MVSTALAVSSNDGDNDNDVVVRINALWELRGLAPLTQEQADFVRSVLEGSAKKHLPGPVDTATRWVLEGPAGTGKTTALVALAVGCALLNLNIVICATTHKAASVLDSKLDEWRNTVSVPNARTIHSLLNLKPHHKFGEPETFKQSKVPYLSDLDLIVVDECSMVGLSLLTYILNDSASAGVPVLFAGDPYQLPPVGERKQSEAFNKGEKILLTKVLRHDGAILNLATKLRSLPFVPRINAAEGGGSSVLTYPDSEAFEEGWLNRLQLTDGSIDTIMLCYTNANRRRLNDKARKILYGPDVPRFQSGDVLVAISAVEQGGMILLNNNQEIQIDKVHLIPDYKPVADLDYCFACWNILTACDRMIFVLDDAEIDRFQTVVKDLGKSIKQQITATTNALARPQSVTSGLAERRALQAARSRWTREYYPLRTSFAELDFRYAMTIHKSQGSTYNNVFITKDYMHSKEATQLLYVAVTRAAKEVHH